MDDDEEVYDPESAFQDVGTSNSSKAAKKQRVDIMASAPGTASNDPQFSDDDDSPRNAPIRSKNQVEKGSTTSGANFKFKFSPILINANKRLFIWSV